MRIGKLRMGRLAMVTANGGFMICFVNDTTTTELSTLSLRNALPVCHTWLDASGQYGPAVIDGTKGDDVIIGSDGDPTIHSRGGHDFVCGGTGNDPISVEGGNSLARGDTGHANPTALHLHTLTLVRPR